MIAKLWAIVRREYLERVRTRSFVISTILVPTLMAAMMIVPAIIASKGGKPLRVAVVDATGSLQAEAEAALRAARLDEKARFEVMPSPGGSLDAREAALRQQAFDGRIDGWVVLPKDAVEKASASYYGRNVSNMIDFRVMARSLGDLLLGCRLRSAGIDPVRVKELTKELDLKTIRISASGEREDRGAAFLASIILMTILYTTIIMWGQVVMTGVIEEKNTRVVEVMASGVPATMLLGGKLLGIGAAGLTQFAVWVASLFAVSASGAGIGFFRMPELSPLMLASFVVFFLLGFLLYAALYAAIGAAVNTVQEAQNFAFPVLLPLLAGFVCFSVVLQSPDSGLSVALSLVPLISPLLMFLRIVVLTPPLWQIALSVLLLLATILGVLWFSARIYRVGILMYGKKPTFPELLRWVRHT